MKLKIPLRTTYIGLCLSAVGLFALATFFWRGDAQTPRKFTAQDNTLVELLTKANNGDSESQLKLGKKYYLGEGVPTNSAEAVRWFIKAAEDGNIKAERIYGMFLLTGDSVPKNPSEGAKWITKAATKGSAAAQFDLCRLYYNGEGVPKDWSEAIRWCRKSAEQDYASAEGFLGRQLFLGQGIATNKIESVEWLRKAAEQGNAQAELLLGTAYQNGARTNQVASSRRNPFEEVNRKVDNIFAPLLTNHPDVKRTVSSRDTAVASSVQETVVEPIEEFGVINDDVQAYKWLNLAAANNDSAPEDVTIAKRGIAILESRMSNSQIEEAQSLSRNFKPRSRISSQTDPD